MSSMHLDLEAHQKKQIPVNSSRPFGRVWSVHWQERVEAGCGRRSRGCSGQVNDRDGATEMWLGESEQSGVLATPSPIRNCTGKIERETERLFCGMVPQQENPPWYRLPSTYPWCEQRPVRQTKAICFEGARADKVTRSVEVAAEFPACRVSCPPQQPFSMNRRRGRSRFRNRFGVQTLGQLLPPRPRGCVFIVALPQGKA